MKEYPFETNPELALVEALRDLEKRLLYSGAPALSQVESYNPQKASDCLAELISQKR